MSDQPVYINDVVIGSMNAEHSRAIIALARAVEANARAIEAIATKAKVEFQTGIVVERAAE